MSIIASCYTCIIQVMHTQVDKVALSTLEWSSLSKNKSIMNLAIIVSNELKRQSSGISGKSGKPPMLLWKDTLATHVIPK